MNKEERTENDVDWLNTMNAEYARLIETALTRVRYEYNPALPVIEVEPDHSRTRVYITQKTTIECIQGITKGKACALDFASYRHPGGGFLKGAEAQEEDICRNSILYPILDGQRKWYNRHYREGSSLYSNDYLFCRKVPVLTDEPRKFKWVDFLIMAAPRNVQEVPDEVYQQVLYLRQLHAFLAPRVRNEHVDTLILGAWGCGVFKNDPKVIASNWKKITAQYEGLYRRIYHPIPDDETLKVFEDVYAE